MPPDATLSLISLLKRPARALGLFAAAGMSLLALAEGARADAAADFFKGKTMRLVNGGAAGSGYDLYSRMLAPWLEKKLGVTVVVESRPGAGMMTAMNHTWIQPADGLTIMLAPGEGAVLSKLVDDQSLRFDVAKYSMIARVNTAPRVMIVYPKGPIHSMADILKLGKPLQIGSNGKVDGVSDTTAIFCHAFNLPCKIVIGYKSSADFSLAAIRGEVDGTILVEDSAARYAQGGQLRAVMTMGRERSRIMPEAPSLFEATKVSDEQAWWLDFREDVRKIGRLLIGPPNMEPARLALLRKVAKDILTDPEALKEFEAKQQPALYGDPQEMTALVNRILGEGLSAARKAEIKHVIMDKYY
jgi:tripartite-type tricarboxylate transporter receptor subunit TctC